MNFVVMGQLPNQLTLDRLKKAEKWLEPRATDDYIMLTSTVIFKSEKDAMLFKLGFRYD